MQKINDEIKKVIKLFEENNFIDSEKLILELINENPNLSILDNIYGAILLKSDSEKAKFYFNRAISKDPNFFNAYYNLGLIYLEKKDYLEAIKYFEKTVDINKNYLEGYMALSQALMSLKRYSEAIKVINETILLNPNDHRLYNNIGLAYQRLNNIEEAIKFFNKSINLNMSFYETYINLAICYLDVGKNTSAEKMIEIAISLNSNSSLAHRIHASILDKQSFYFKALESINKSLQIEPLNNESLILLMKIYLNTLQQEKWMDLYFKIDFSKCDLGDIFPLPLSSLYIKDFKNNEYFSLLKKFKSLINKNDLQDFKFNNKVLNKNELRIGFLSADLRNHSVSFCLSDFFKELGNRKDIKIYAYNNNKTEDDMTFSLKKYFHAWSDIFNKNDHELINIIRKDNLHFLIDLSGFTKGSRVSIFNYRSAKIQLSWIGYLSSVGLDNIDFLVADPYVIPKHEEQNYLEKIVRLPDIWTPFAHPEKHIEILETPALKNGHITFGSFNQLSKINIDVISVWSKILINLPNSKLYLKAYQLNDLKNQQTIKELFSNNSVTEDRLIFRSYEKTREDLLKAYNDIDIALDPFPYNGMTTSLECAWMCTPILTKIGDSFVSRTGASININLGLKEWNCVDETEYVNKAIMFASDYNKLQEIQNFLKINRSKNKIFSKKLFVDDFIFLLRDILNNNQ
jgi:predicted O-linked N-acetylglucosamine transferase (SPINDLY family)